jgi:hypothetical protein
MSLQAHIAEHLGFNYRKQIEEKLGVPLPPPDQPLSEEIEVELARLVADAGKQLTANSSARSCATRRPNKRHKILYCSYDVRK